MGQVLGFSHCKEFGSVSSTPDSTPPCTDGGNEESDFPELQTAREWSEDEDGGEDDEGGTSSPSVWGTPRQNSFELTFSYIAFTEPEGGGASRRDSMGGGRRRGGARGSGRTALSRGSTEESLLPAESPELEWEHRTFLLGEEEEEGEEEGRERQAILSQQLPSLELRTQPPSQSSPAEPQNEPVLSLELRTQPPSQSPPPEPQNQQLSTLELRTQPPSQSPPPEPQGKTSDSQDDKQEEPSGTPHYSQSDSFSVLLLPGADSLVATETMSAPLTFVQPGSEVTEGISSSSSPSVGRDTQEEPSSRQWFSASDLSEDSGWCIRIAVTDLIYWRDTERTGMVFTGLVVGLLSLFQLSFITVVSTLSLAAMCFTIAVRLYYKVLDALQWADGKHPFQSYLDLDITLSTEQAGTYMERVIVMTTSAIAEIKRLLFVDSLINSLKVNS